MTPMAATSVTDIFRLDADNSDRWTINLRIWRHHGPAVSGAVRLTLTVLRQSTDERAAFGVPAASGLPSAS
jgi:hypothetical protein